MSIGVKSPLKKMGVFCGASLGENPCYRDSAIQLAQAMVNARLALVYGGTKVGLMKLLADYLIVNNREVIGIIPKFLVDAGIMHTQLTQCQIVTSISERKSTIFALADAYVLLPGGLGSLDEFFEVAVMTQLGIHKKPCGILNSNGYYDDMIQFLNHATGEGFIRAEHRKMIIIDDCPQQLLGV
ncbi:MAG: TIGR00730 family Rossman fold protein [Gammaproteobacteria bacterium]|nr:TIGR00730 family Rossman fold protein [Gammaproteobacteria bacterium]